MIVRESAPYDIVVDVLPTIHPHRPRNNFIFGKARVPAQFNGAANEGALIVKAMIRPEMTAVDGSVINHAL